MSVVESKVLGDLQKCLLIMNGWYIHVKIGDTLTSSRFPQRSREYLFLDMLENPDMVPSLRITSWYSFRQPLRRSSSTAVACSLHRGEPLLPSRPSPGYTGKAMWLQGLRHGSTKVAFWTPRSTSLPACVMFQSRRSFSEGRALPRKQQSSGLSGTTMAKLWSLIH